MQDGEDEDVVGDEEDEAGCVSSEEEQDEDEEGDGGDEKEKTSQWGVEIWMLLFILGKPYPLRCFLKNIFLFLVL
jgi:hypothetical protein